MISPGHEVRNSRSEKGGDHRTALLGSTWFTGIERGKSFDAGGKRKDQSAQRLLHGENTVVACRLTLHSQGL